MKTFLFLFGLGIASSVFAEPPIVTTAIGPSAIVNTNGAVEWAPLMTNSIAIPNGQAARVATVKGESPAYFVKSDRVFTAVVGDVIQGPAVFYLINTPGREDTLLTVERWTVRKSR